MILLGQHVISNRYNYPNNKLFDYEEKLNNDKRNIFILKPIYLNILFDDIDQIMRNKKGSTQFISETLVRGDDIRLFD